MVQHRASFDASVTFSNGGDLSVHGFRVDLPSADVTPAEVATLFVASLGLLMTDEVVVTNLEVFPEPHKGTRGGPSERKEGDGTQVLDLTGPGTVMHGPVGLYAEHPAVVVRAAGEVPALSLAPFDVAGAAVLLEGASGLARDGAAWLLDNGAAIIGTDAPLLEAEGLPVVVGLVGLDMLPATGARFTAAPQYGLPGPLPVRAFART